MVQAAPLSKPVQKRPIMSNEPTAPLALNGKRPRDHGTPKLKPVPPPKAESKSNGRVVKALPGKMDQSAMRKAMHIAFIEDALAKKALGDIDRYTELIGQFKALSPTQQSAPVPSTSSATAGTPSSAQLRLWLDALTHVVSKLDSFHSTLVETILSLPWATMDDNFVAAYVRFLSALVSARPEWLRSILDKSVKGFRYKSAHTIGSTQSMPSITRRVLYSRLHALLKILLNLIPTLSPSLAPLLAQHFPSRREPRTAQICYIDNLLTLSEYCPALSEDVLTLVMGRALNIDVEIQGDEDWEEVEEELQADQAPSGPLPGVQEIVDRPTEEDEEEDSSDDEDDDESGELDLEDLDSDDEPNPVSDDEAERKARGGAMSEATIRRILEHRSKLDAIMKVLLDHIAAAYKAAPSASSTPTTLTTANASFDYFSTDSTGEIKSRRKALFATMLDIFDRTLLRTFKTRNVQFVLFYLCSLDTASSDHFIGVLLGRALFELDAAAVTRVAAAGYVASFVSRAQFVDAVMTRKVVRHLCQFLEHQMDDLAAGSAQDLPVFYAAAQAVFYIFCFRWKDLLDESEEDDIVFDDSGRRWMMGLETVKKAVGSSYNPLKHCAQPVVNQFAQIAHKTNFMYCFHVLDSNRRTASRERVPSANGPTPAKPTRSSSTHTIRGSDGPVPRQLLVQEEMDSFFPFDPFKLPLSSTFIDDIYREWEADDDETASDADSDSDEDDDASSSAVDTASDSEWIASGGLEVPGALRREKDEVDDEVARSFEVMSLSPDQPSFGGRGTPASMPSILI